MWDITKNEFSTINIWILASYFVCQVVSQNTPPQVTFDRDWILTENEPIDSIVTRIQVSDDDNDAVNVTLGSPSSISFQNRADGYTFFKVDKEHRVRLAKSLQGMAGQNFLVGVIAHDGSIVNRVDVQVTIKKPNQRIKVPPSGLTSFFDPGLPPKDLPQYSFSETNRYPLILLDPFTTWKVPASTPVGTHVTKVEASDFSDSYLKFSFHPAHLLHIDSDTGDVTVAQSLNDEVGDHELTLNVSNQYAHITEKVTLRISAVDPSIDVQSTSGTKSINLIPKYDAPKEHPKPEVTTIKPSSTVIYTDPSNEVTPSVEKESTLGWTISILVLVFGVLPLVLAGIFLLWRWRRIKNVKTPSSKNLSVSYSEKRGSIDSQGQPRNMNRIVDGLFSMVGIHRRAESNGYTSDVKIPKVPSRDSSKSCKSAKNSTIHEEKDEWEFMRHKLRVMSILGEGCFGQVWKYEATDLIKDGPTIVAVKTLKESAGEEEQKDLLQELKVLKSLGHHPNVVSLLGCCTEKDPIFVILEYLPGGTLQGYLRESRAGRAYDNLHGISGTLTPRDLTIFALQVAKGMDFLSKFGIIHRDLAARNILIGEDKVCKVADFGFARDVANNHVYERKSEGRLPIRWMAPESLYDNIFTTKSDVWSFGILLWEVVTLGSTPYPGLSAQDVMRKVKDGYRLDKPDHCKREIYNIMYYCWDVDQCQRPSFAELVQTLDSLIRTEVDYIRLDNFPDHSYYNFSSGTATGELL